MENPVEQVTLDTKGTRKRQNYKKNLFKIQRSKTKKYIKYIPDGI